MKNIGIAIVAIIIILIVAGGGFFFLKSSKTPVKTQVQTNNTKAAESQSIKRNAVKGTILSLLDGGKTVSCTVNLPDNKGNGTFYVANSKQFAGDFTSKGTDGKDIATHMISDGTYVYIWSAAMPSGFKMKLETARNATNNAQTNQAVNLNQNVDMQCGAWTVDNSKFTVPSNIEFRDMSGFLQQAQPQVTTAPATGGTQTGASACDQVPAGPARTACENAMQSSGQ
jgi:type II secretory pathway pseudopilin PulG